MTQTSLSSHTLHPITERLVSLRWHSISALIIFALIVPHLVSLRIPVPTLLGFALMLGCINLLCYWPHWNPASPNSILAQLTADLLAWSGVLYFTGGASNPLITLLLPPVAIGATLLPRRHAWLLTGLSVLAYTCLWQWSEPLHLDFPDSSALAPHNHQHHSHPVAEAAPPASDPSLQQEAAIRWHLAGMWLTFAVTAGLITGSVVRLTRQIRERDEAIAQIRENLLRDQHILALGNLAAGAAHKLGTPLNSVALLMDDLRHDARLPEDALEDCDLAYQETLRCKSILAVLSQQNAASPINEFMTCQIWWQTIIEHWRNHSPEAQFVQDIRDTNFNHLLINPEPTLELAIHNFMDNAWRENKTLNKPIKISIEYNNSYLLINIGDSGTGLPEEILQTLGKEPAGNFATGMGIGILLAVSSIKRNNGTVDFHQNIPNGTIVSIRLPVTQEVI